LFLNTRNFIRITSYDLKIIIRNNPAILIISVFTVVFLHLTYALVFSKLNIGFLSFYVMLFLHEFLYNNIFSREKNEFHILSILPVSFRNLVILKNVNNFIITFSVAVFSSVLMFVLKFIKPDICLELFMFLIPAIMIISIIGNYVSLMSAQRDEQRFQYLFLFFHSIGIGIANTLYFVTYRLFNSLLLYFLYLSIVLICYYLSISHVSSLLEKFKFKLLERP